MNKKKENGCKKLFVRNSSVSVRPREVIEIQPAGKHNSENEEIESEKSERFKDLRAPDFCTVLRLAGEIKKVREECFGKIYKDDGVKSRNLNFSPDEKIYQDLVDLDLNENHSNKPRSHSSHSMIKKDPEPDINKMTKYDLQPEFVFSTSAVPEIKKKGSEFNGRSLYNHTKKWKC